MTHLEGAGCTQGLLGECSWGLGIPRGGVPGFPFALGTELAQRAQQYLAPCVGRVFHLAGGKPVWQPQLESMRWHLEGEQDFWGEAGVLFPRGGWCLVARGGYWGAPGHTFWPCSWPSALSRQQLEDLQRGRCSSQGCSGKGHGLGHTGTTGAERGAYVLLQPLVPGSVRGRRIRGWVLDGRDTPVTSW